MPGLLESQLRFFFEQDGRFWNVDDLGLGYLVDETDICHVSDKTVMACEQASIPKLNKKCKTYRQPGAVRH